MPALRSNTPADHLFPQSKTTNHSLEITSLSSPFFRIHRGWKTHPSDSTRRGPVHRMNSRRGAGLNTTNHLKPAALVKRDICLVRRLQKGRQAFSVNSA